MLVIQMSDEKNSKKSGTSTILLIGVLLVILLAFFMVPFAAIGLALKKSGALGQQAAREAAQADGQKTDAKQIPDLSGLRAVVEKAASNALAQPKFIQGKDGFQIQVVPPATLDTASSKVKDVLTKNHFQFVEAYDHELIRIIVILKSSEWPELVRLLGEATDLYGFEYRGPSETKTTSKGSDTTVARIEITRKPIH